MNQDLMADYITESFYFDITKSETNMNFQKISFTKNAFIP